jgi:hypothetical protein
MRYQTKNQVEYFFLKKKQFSSVLILDLKTNQTKLIFFNKKLKKNKKKSITLKLVKEKSNLKTHIY